MSGAKYRHSSAGTARLGQRPPRAWRRFLQTCGKGCALLTVFASLAFPAPAAAESWDRWQVYRDIGPLEGVALRIHWFADTAALREAAKNSGVSEARLKAFSILKRNTKTGEYVCDLYVVKMTGAPVDGDETTTVGHEMLHCLGLHHEDTFKAIFR